MRERERERGRERERERERVSKLGISLGIEEVIYVWLHFLGRLSNSTPLFSKHIFRILPGCLRPGIFGDCLGNFDSMISRAKKYQLCQWIDLESFASLSLRKSAFEDWLFSIESTDVLLKICGRSLIRKQWKLLRKLLGLENVLFL